MRTCLFHSPEFAASRAAGRRAGGQTRSRQRAVIADAPVVCFASVSDVTKLLSETATATRRGELDPKVASTLGYLGSIALRSLVQGDIEQRLLAIEEQLAAEKKEGGHRPMSSQARRQSAVRPACRTEAEACRHAAEGANPDA